MMSLRFRIRAGNLGGYLIPAFFMLLSWGLGDELVREIEIRSEPEANGHKDFTVRLLPGHTFECESVQFECVYHQEFPWEDVRGRKYTKIYEPVNFKYQRKNVKFVNDLDTYISFRVPIGRDLLENAYGETAFAKGYPITISRIKITAFAEGKPIWSYEVPAEGKHLVASLQSALPALPPQKPGEKAADLDESLPPKEIPKLP